MDQPATGGVFRGTG